jgi:hypothetical protein
MKFMLMLTPDAGAVDSESQAEKDRVDNEYMKIISELEVQGKLVESRRLRPSIEAATVRSRNGKPVAVDELFSESKEVIGGFYVIECDWRDEAIEWAKKMPHFEDLRYSGIEVRPICE